MTLEQIKLVQESFPLIQEMAHPIAMLFYGRLFQLDPTLRPMFRQDIELQGRKLMDMLTALVDNLSQAETLTPALEALGQRHTGYGVRPEHYETVSRAFLWAIGKALDRSFRPATRAAWTALMATVAERMKEGAKKIPEAGSI